MTSGRVPCTISDRRRIPLDVLFGLDGDAGAEAVDEVAVPNYGQNGAAARQPVMQVPFDAPPPNGRTYQNQGWGQPSPPGAPMDVPMSRPGAMAQQGNGRFLPMRMPQQRGVGAPPPPMPPPAAARAPLAALWSKVRPLVVPVLVVGGGYLVWRNWPQIKDALTRIPRRNPEDHSRRRFSRRKREVVGSDDDDARSTRYEDDDE